MIRKLDLIAQLQRIPGNPYVCTWQGGSDRPAEPEELHIEQVVVANDTDRDPVIVLGFEIDTRFLNDAETAWSDR